MLFRRFFKWLSEPQPGEDFELQNEQDKIREFTLRHDKDVANTFIIEVMNESVSGNIPPVFFDWMFPKYKNGMQLYLFDSEEYNMLIPEYKDFIQKKK